MSRGFGSEACYYICLSFNVNDGTDAGINALRRLKIKRCGELASRLSSHLTFAWGYVAFRGNH